MFSVYIFIAGVGERDSPLIDNSVPLLIPMCHKLNLPSKLFVARNGCTKSADAKETALDWAVKHGNLEMAEMVAKAGVDVNAKSVLRIPSAHVDVLSAGIKWLDDSALDEMSLNIHMFISSICSIRSLIVKASNMFPGVQPCGTSLVTSYTR
ncbi:hypothetical protein Q9966_000679 [Columba livia]|nr:hypothetical protein Q9966_000679 [Columba livia]